MNFGELGGESKFQFRFLSMVSPLKHVVICDMGRNLKVF
jgi:hypothetical protein